MKVLHLRRRSIYDTVHFQLILLKVKISLNLLYTFFQSSQVDNEDCTQVLYQQPDGTYVDGDGNTVDLSQYSIVEPPVVASGDSGRYVSSSPLPDSVQAIPGSMPSTPSTTTESTTATPASDVAAKHRSGERKLVEDAPKSDYFEDHLITDFSETGNCIQNLLTNFDV